MGESDTIAGVGHDGLGFTASTFAVTSATDLLVDTYYLEYDNAAGTLWFHYKVAGYVPEPQSLSLLALGAFLVRYRRRVKRQ